LGITILTEFTIGVSQRDRNNAKLSRLLLQYKAAKGVGVGVLLRDTNNMKYSKVCVSVPVLIQ